MRSAAQGFAGGLSPPHPPCVNPHATPPHSQLTTKSLQSLFVYSNLLTLLPPTKNPHLLSPSSTRSSMPANGFFLTPLFVDLVVLGLIFASSVFSHGRRFSGEFCSLLNWLAPLALLYFTYSYWNEFLLRFFDSSRLGFLLIVGVFFLLVFAALFILTNMLAASLRNYVSARFDRFLGLIYGIFRGLVIVCVVFGFLQTFGSESRLSRQLSESFSAPYIFPLTQRALRFLGSMNTDAFLSRY